MRIQITFDGASTDTVREMAVALHNVGLTGKLQVGCDGPEKWNGTTPKMTPQQWASVTARLVKFQGQPIADALDALRSA
jgi:hypothetical protein